MIFDKNQQKVIDQLQGNLAVIATAGSGKTTVLTHRIKNLVQNGVNPRSVLAITFSKKSREAIVAKLDSLSVKNVQVETFHSFALKIIRKKYGMQYAVWTEHWKKENVIKDLIKKYGVDEDSLSSVMLFISDKKTRGIKPDQLPKSINAKIYQDFLTYQAQHDLLEFDDFMNIANSILDADTDILNHYKQTLRFVLVDEYQDVSESQAVLLQKINTGNTMIVGDPLQAIYSFRGGDSKFILDFDTVYNDVSVVNLNVNYRCSQEIVNASNVFAKTIPDTQHRNYVVPIAFNKRHGPVRLLKNRNPYEEASRIIDEIKDKQDVTILARTNAQLQVFQSELTKRHMLFSTPGGAVFGEQPEIKLILAYLQLSVDTSNDAAFSHLYNKPHRWLDKKFFQETSDYATRNKISLYDAMSDIPRAAWRFSAGIKEIRDVIKGLRTKHRNVGLKIGYLRKKLNLDEYWKKGIQDDDGKELEKIENMNSFQEFCKDYKDVPSLLSHMNDVCQSVETDAPIKLMTMHKSKGLEFDTVFVVGVNDGLLPHYRSDDIDDERRLFYVAMTRAKQHLWISTLDTYNGDPIDKSQFIESIRKTLKLKRRSRGTIEK